MREGQVKTTYGTGCFILQNVGEKPILSKNGLLGTVCYRIGDKTYYALEGAVEVAGAAISWAKSVGIITDTKQIEPEALSVSDCGDVYFVPAFGGLLSPHYRDDARGLLIGMSQNTERGHLMRAFIEAPCLRTAEVVQAMSSDAEKRVTKMAVDGGMTVNNLMMQTQSDLINAEIVRKHEKEITSCGAAIAAGLQVGYWESLEALEQSIKTERVFKPEKSHEWR